MKIWLKSTLNEPQGQCKHIKIGGGKTWLKKNTATEETPLTIITHRSKLSLVVSERHRPTQTGLISVQGPGCCSRWKLGLNSALGVTVHKQAEQTSNMASGCTTACWEVPGSKTRAQSVSIFNERSMDNVQQKI